MIFGVWKTFHICCFCRCWSDINDLNRNFHYLMLLVLKTCRNQKTVKNKVAKLRTKRTDSFPENIELFLDSKTCLVWSVLCMLTAIITAKCTIIKGQNKIITKCKNCFPHQRCFCVNFCLVVSLLYFDLR